MNDRCSAVGRARGMALIVSLVILLSLTLLGLAAIQNTTLEERMAGNTRAENIALQAAESGLRAGETWIVALPTQLQAGACNGDGKQDEICTWESPDPQWSADPDVWPADDDQYAWWEQRSPTWWNGAHAATDALPFWQTSGDTPELKGIAATRLPHYVIEERGLLKDTLVIGQQQDFTGRMAYQITARGLDDAGRGEAILRSTAFRRF
jgi:type IV pilus assembly protein PilX